jgi:hypothetical protein
LRFEVLRVGFKVLIKFSALFSRRHERPIAESLEEAGYKLVQVSLESEAVVEV